MVTCFTFFLFAAINLSDAEPLCGTPITWLYLNYYLLILIVIGPAMTLGVVVVFFAMCAPCFIYGYFMQLRARREKTQVEELVSSSLASRTYNAKQFKAQDECVICMEPFKEGCKVTPLPCNIKHYFHSNCI
jgi:hypothetical protein